jgi:hypothetical protein
VALIAATRSVTAEPFVEAIPQIPHTVGQCKDASNEGLRPTPSG